MLFADGFFPRIGFTGVPSGLREQILTPVDGSEEDDAGFKEVELEDVTDLLWRVRGFQLQDDILSSATAETFSHEIQRWSGTAWDALSATDFPDSFSELPYAGGGKFERYRHTSPTQGIFDRDQLIAWNSTSSAAWPRKTVGAPSGAFGGFRLQYNALGFDVRKRGGFGNIKDYWLKISEPLIRGTLSDWLRYEHEDDDNWGVDIAYTAGFAELPEEMVYTPPVHYPLDEYFQPSVYAFRSAPTRAGELVLKYLGRELSWPIYGNIHVITVGQIVDDAPVDPLPITCIGTVTADLKITACDYYPYGGIYDESTGQPV